MTLIVDCIFRNRMCKFYHALLDRDNHSRVLQKLSLNILEGFRKLNMKDSRAPLSKIVVLQL